MEKIIYEPIIAGALSKFESLDSVDFSLLVIDLAKKLNIEAIGSWYYSPNYLGKYIETINGTIKLKDGISLDYLIEEENCTLREKLLAIAGDKIANYFNNLDIEKHKARKEKVMIDNKGRALSGVNVLLISDTQDDYDELIKYGFQNVNYFKSIIRADQYFNKHPEELESYHLILKGKQTVQYFDGNAELDRAISKLSNNNSILTLSLYKYDYLDHIELVTHLDDRNNHKSWDVKETTYQGLFDRIVENVLINQILEKSDPNDKKFIPIQDYINQNRLPIPTQKSDLKILYLDFTYDSKYADKITSELGLNIDFKEDNNSSLGRYVKNNLGEYDIIIATRIYSGSILNMNYESTEQCKDTGKELNLLVTQDQICYWADSNLADGVKLEYVFGGNLALDFEHHSKEFRILKQPIATESDDDYQLKQGQNKYSQTKGIIEASVNIYNQALLQKDKPGISDLDFKTAEELEQDYINVYEYQKAIKDAELIPIRLFDNIRYSVINYLNYKNNGLINQVPQGIKITEEKDNIRVENVYQGRTLCAIVFSKKYEQDNLRMFEVQTLSKKGILSPPQTIGVYTSEYENLENIPNRPDEKQENALISIEKKISTNLKPLNEEALKNRSEQGTQSSEIVKPKRKIKKRRQ